MYIVSVTIWVKPEFVEQFKAATLDNARNSRREPGNLRFDVSQGEGDATRFLLYECYGRKEDFVAHQQTAHYLKWRDVANEWMAQPRQSMKYASVFYGESEQ